MSTQALVFLVGDVRELWPFLVALFVSLLQSQTRFGLQTIISVTRPIVHGCTLPCLSWTPRLDFA